MLCSGSISTTYIVSGCIASGIIGVDFFRPQTETTMRDRDGVLWKCGPKTNWQWVKDAGNWEAPLFVNPFGQ